MTLFSQQHLAKTVLATACLAVFSGAVFSGAAMANTKATVLNQNFESDTLPIATLKNSQIAGWSNAGTGAIGNYVPKSGTDYTSVGSHSQVAYMEGGGKIRQVLQAKVVAGETYTLTFDAGRPLDQDAMFVTAKLIANSFTMAQTAANHTQQNKGEWNTYSLSFTADQSMPISSPIAIEFHNLSFGGDSRVDIDNVQLTATGGLPNSQVRNFVQIEEFTTLAVPSDYANINEALAYLHDKFIANDAVVTIQVDDCSNQVYNQPIEIIHPHGKQIEIIGNVSNPSNCVLQFNGSSGFEIAHKRKLRLINGFHIQGDRTAGTSGVSATKGAGIRIGAATAISDFHNGVEASLSGRVYANTVLISGNTGSGVVSKYSGFVQANGAQSKNNELHGFHSVDGGIMQANNSKALGNKVNGYFSENFGHIQSNEAEANNNLDSGFFATGKAYLDAHASTANNNPTGFQCDYNGYMKRTEASEESSVNGHVPDVSTYKNGCYMH